MATDIQSGESNGHIQLCERCRSQHGAVSVRNQHYCNDCFKYYVASKVLKRMDMFKVRSQALNKRKFLLPLSLGPSSVTLLHVLDGHLNRQKDRSGRTGYDLHVLLVFAPGREASEPGDDSLLSAFRRVQAHYPSYQFSHVKLSDFFSFHSVDEELSIPHVGRAAWDDEQVQHMSNEQKLNAFLSLLPSATSRQDIVTVLQTRLIASIAQDVGCECIVWGDSATRLAEKTLADTAKGRGFSLPWATSDGHSALGVQCYFPMSDLLRKEILTYGKVIDPPLSTLAYDPKIPPSAAATLDSLMGKYFETVELTHPSIVASVVRTVNRLEAPPSDDITSSCQLCGYPLTEWDGPQVATVREGDGTDAIAGLERPRIASKYCYGCCTSLGIS
ncbi:cytoplasmic tRNA 2-thiolation protein 2 [Agyrium rufum]|nr:cytoplasmic tRNA 2-thiolation protein 2 [Agyrium rufum]